jgi:hypothetical protein
MHKCVSVCLYEESDPIYVVAKSLKWLHQPTTLTFNRIISVLGVVSDPGLIATQVPVLIFVFVLHDRPPPL